ncbi:MAG: hypothetical protein ACREPD_15645 [Stenotrophomonas sp.]|uniref:hypothetical protein n=1 Tax=Gammaproteobacteria TaxID=1236 RepID=UPI003D6D55DE
MSLVAIRFGFRASPVKWAPLGGGVCYGMRVSSAQAYAGKGFLAGEAPSTSDPDGVDGRFRILNQPAQGRILVFDRGTTNCIASLFSKPDGTWRLDRLHPDLVLTVIGYDDSGKQNAAVQDWVRPAVEG